MKTRRSLCLRSLVHDPLGLKFEQEKTTADVGKNFCKILKSQTEFWQVPLGLGRNGQIDQLGQGGDLQECGREPQGQAQL